MTILLALAIFGLLMTICVHFLMVEEKRIKNRKSDAPVYWQPSYITNRATSAKRQA